jgi:hypothetical protein
VTAEDVATMWDDTGICPNQVIVMNSHYRHCSCGWKLSVPNKKLMELACNMFQRTVDKYKYKCNDETKTFC